MLKYFPLGFQIAGLYQGKRNQKVKRVLALIQILWSWYKNTSPNAFTASMSTNREPFILRSHSGSQFSWKSGILCSSFRWRQWWHQLEDTAWKDYQPHHSCQLKRKEKKKNTTVAWWQIYYSLGQISLWWQLGIKLLLPGWVRRGSEEQFLFYQCLFQVLILNTQCYIFSQIIFLYHLIVYEWCDSNCCAESSILTSLKKTPKKKKKWNGERIELSTEHY